MATVTHGGTLPDTSDKSDFYNIIDTATVGSIVNADIASGAAIADTKLATIVTASKVNVSALTGQVANTNLAQITEAAKVSGAALTLLPNIPALAGIIPVANIGGLFGTWASKNVNQIYQALTDGIVTAWATGGASVRTLAVTGITDANATPTTVRIKNESAGLSGGDLWLGVTFPVKKNDYYEVTIAGDTTAGTAFFIPLGS
jgi:hypothetical protein